MDSNIIATIIGILGGGGGVSIIWYISTRIASVKAEAEMKSLREDVGEIHNWIDRHGNENKTMNDNFANGVTRFAQIDMTLVALKEAIDQLKKVLDDFAQQFQNVKDKVNEHEYQLKSIGKTK